MNIHFCIKLRCPSTHSHATIIFLVIVYYIAVFADLCAYLNMPLMTVCRNVYCDGVYDLCHIGHKTLFRNALMFGNRLFVGVSQKIHRNLVA